MDMNLSENASPAPQDIEVQEAAEKLSHDEMMALEVKDTIEYISLQYDIPVNELTYEPANDSSGVAAILYKDEPIAAIDSETCKCFKVYHDSIMEAKSRPEAEINAEKDEASL